MTQLYFAHGILLKVTVATTLEHGPIDENSAAENPPEQAESKNSAMLSSQEARILGSLMEKQMATPDAYPLTVNSLINACNQKSSREPVTNLQQGEVVRLLRQLESRKLVRYEMGARSERYEQTLTKELSLSRKQQALLCIMLLRGPQTTNELLTRTQRLYSFENKDDMQVSLTRMTQGEDPIACRISRSPGQRDDRYGHLLCGDLEQEQTAFSEPTTTDSIASNDGSESEDSKFQHSQYQDSKKIEALTDEVLELREMLEKLYQLTGHPLSPN